MAKIIRIDYEALAKIADRFGQEAEAIEQMLQMVRGAMTPLQNGGWVGRGSDAFFAEMESDVLPAVRRLADALGQANEVSRKIGDVMQAAEGEACSPFRAGDLGGAAGQAVGAAGGSMSSGAAGAAPGGGMYVPQDWLNNVRRTAPPAGNGFNDWGIPQNWLDGVAGTMGVGGGSNNWGIPNDWLGGVTDAANALGGSGAAVGGAAVGSAAGDAGSVGGAGGASGAAAEPPPNMPSGGAGGSKGTAAADISSPYGRQGVKTGSSTLFGGGKAVAEAQNGRVSYQSLGAAAFGSAANAASVPAASGAARGAASASSGDASGSAGIGLAVAALAPLLGIMGKSVKDVLGKE